ncbi:hypothetical protein, partial [Massilia cavernae]|uniref:hypothetical protein n=1 Tax=Massilia cavernae TaxID=2320864 RepID=UPI001E324A19
MRLAQLFFGRDHVARFKIELAQGETRFHIGWIGRDGVFQLDDGRPGIALLLELRRFGDQFGRGFLLGAALIPQARLPRRRRQRFSTVEFVAWRPHQGSTSLRAPGPDSKAIGIRLR